MQSNDQTRTVTKLRSRTVNSYSNRERETDLSPTSLGLTCKVYESIAAHIMRQESKP